MASDPKVESPDIRSPKSIPHDQARSIHLAPMTKIELTILFVISLLLCLLGYRLTLGVGLSDESFYLTMAESVIAWGKPFTVIENLAQISALLVVPFVIFWQSGLHMGSDGIILFLRFLYLILACTSSFFLFVYARTRLDRPVALLLSVLPVVWIPYGLPACSYNTLGENFFLIGLILHCLSPSIGEIRQTATQNLLSILAPLPFIIACIAYPTFALPIIAFLAITYFFSPSSQAKRQAKLSALLIIGIGLLIAVSVILLCGWENIDRALVIMSEFEKAYSTLKHDLIKQQLLTGNFPFLSFFSLLCGSVTAFTKNQVLKNWAIIAFCAVLIMAASIPSSMYLQSHTAIILLATFLSPLLFSKQEIPFTIRTAMVCSLLAAAITTSCSTTIFYAFPLGAFPFVCFGLCEILRTLFDASGRFTKPIAWILIGTIVAVLFSSSWQFLFGESSFNLWQSERVPNGAFRWLRTSPQKRQLILDLTRDFAALDGHCRTIYVAGQPGIYLCSGLKPLDPMLFHVPQTEALKPILRKYYDWHGPPDVFVWVPDIGFGNLTSFDQELLAKYYSPLVKRKGYTIFQLNKNWR